MVFYEVMREEKLIKHIFEGALPKFFMEWVWCDREIDAQKKCWYRRDKGKYKDEFGNLFSFFFHCFPTALIPPKDVFVKVLIFRKGTSSFHVASMGFYQS